MNIRKKILLCLLIIIISAGIALTTPVYAADIYFAAVNNTILDISYETMPVNIGGTIYVHYRVFGAKEANGGSLGIYVNYSSSTNVVMVVKGDMELRFDLSASKTYDLDGNEYSFKAVFRKGEIFLPASATCEYFGINYSYIVSQEGNTIVRLSVGSVIGDYDFANSKVAADRMAALYEYLVDNTPSQQPPVVLPPSSSPQVSVTPSSRPGFEDVEVFLAFYDIGASGADLLSLLENYNYKACFFFSSQEIAANSDLIREALGLGHGVGLYSAQGTRSDYMNAARALRSASGVKALLAASDLSLADSKVLSELGLLAWFDGNAQIISSGEGYAAYDDFIDMLIDFEDFEDTRLDFIFKLAEDDISGVDAVLSELQAGNFTVRKPRETLIPYIDLYSGLEY